MKSYEVAAKWWADKLRKIISNEVDTNDSTMLVLATMMNIKNKKPTKQSIDCFEKFLAEKFKSEVISYGRAGTLLTFAPDSWFSDFLGQSDIDSEGLYWRVRMEITPDKVIVKSTDKKTPDKVIWLEGHKGEFIIM